jgi:hypothetical protein
MISLSNEVVYFSSHEGYFKARNLNEIAHLLGDEQKMNVKRCSMEDIPRKLNTFPNITTKTCGYIPSGAKIWIISQDGCYHIFVSK